MEANWEHTLNILDIYRAHSDCKGVVGTPPDDFIEGIFEKDLYESI